MRVVHYNPDWDAGGPSVLMSDWWVRAHWGRAFEILAITPQFHNMSWALMRRRDVELTNDDLEKPADDPREYLALRHNLRQLERDIEHALQRQSTDLRRDESLAVSELRREYETSSSWRATRRFERVRGWPVSLRERRVPLRPSTHRTARASPISELAPPRRNYPQRDRPGATPSQMQETPTGPSWYAPGRIRTCDFCLRRAALYPLSYGRPRAILRPWPADRAGAIHVMLRRCSSP